MADELVLGGADFLLRPDALENFGASNSQESSVRFRVSGKEWRPAGQQGEVVMRRLYIAGYHKSSISLYVTPIVDGQYRNDLQAYLSKPAPASGRFEAFSFIVPLAVEHSDYSGFLFGLRGTAFNALLELSDPSAQLYISSLTFAHEPLKRVRARGVSE